MLHKNARSLGMFGSFTEEISTTDGQSSLTYFDCDVWSQLVTEAVQIGRKSASLRVFQLKFLFGKNLMRSPM